MPKVEPTPMSLLLTRGVSAFHQGHDSVMISSEHQKILRKMSITLPFYWVVRASKSYNMDERLSSQ